MVHSFLFQYVTEKMGGAEGTKLDLDFVEMERVSNFLSIIPLMSLVANFFFDVTLF